MAIAFGSSASLSGLFSARPAADAGQVGRFYFATDTNDLYRDNGTAWQHIGTPRSYEVYTALLTQTGTNAPVATVLENTLGGTVVWSRSGVGIYLGTLSGAFPQNKTAVTANIISGDSIAVITSSAQVGDNTVRVFTADGPASTGSGVEDWEISISIRVYP